MPKSTFQNLAPARRDEVISACIKEFEDFRLSEASVKSIVARLGISRGSFYKYFDNLEECYFYILSSYTKQIHQTFIELLRKNGSDIFLNIAEFGNSLAEELFDPAKYKLYRNRYLDWTPLLQMRWQEYGALHESGSIEDFIPDRYRNNEPIRETMSIVKAVIHNLVERCFVETWDKERFIDKYRTHINILISGIKKPSGA